MLIKCNECGREISDKAEICPHCGTPNVVKGEPLNEQTQVNNQQPQPQYQQPQQQYQQPQQQYHQPQQPYYPPPQQGGSNNGLLYAIIGLLAAGLIGLGAYVFLSQQKDEPAQDAGKEVTKVETKAEEKAEEKAPEVEKVIVAEPARKPDNNPQGHFALDGSISKYGCHIDLDLNGTEATGSYYYTSQGRNNRLYLTGEVHGKHVELYEYNDDGEQTGYFNGTFDGITYEGTFINYKSQVMSFKFLAK